MRKKIIYILFLLFSLSGINCLSAQEVFSPYAENRDSLMVVVFQEIQVYPAKVFNNEAEIQQYKKLVRDVKKTLPYAKMIYFTLIETYEFIQTLPDEKSKQAHLKRMEKELFEQYKPILKKMSLSQGKLLIRLVDRECNQTSFNLAKAFLGSFRANFWNVFAGMFGASLKSSWDPDGKDADAERIVRMVEAGAL